jgi:hypothetical protein
MFGIDVFNTFLRAFAVEKIFFENYGGFNKVLSLQDYNKLCNLLCFRRVSVQKSAIWMMLVFFGWRLMRQVE